MAFTKKDEERLDTFCQKYNKLLTEQAPFEDIESIVHEVWNKLGYPSPRVILTDTPMHAYNIVREAGIKDPNKFNTYFAIWFNSYSAMFEWAKENGEDIPDDELDRFIKWTVCCPAIFYDDDEVYVSRSIKGLKVDENQRLHCEDGPAMELHDEHSELEEECNMWFINGVEVTKQIVMSPETQTIGDIAGEINEEIKRIRIDRYGWSRFLEEIDSIMIDENKNDIEGTKEYLFTADLGNTTIKAMLCICPSTGKEFVLEIDPSVETCEEAQSWLSNGLSKRIISAS